MKLFITDLDGTLLDEIEYVGEKNLQSLQELQKHGYTIVIATGRPFSSIEGLHLQEFNPYAITLNGSQIYTPEKQLCHSSPLTNEQTSKIYSYCEERDVTYLVYTDRDVYLYRPKKFMDVLYHMAKLHSHSEAEFIKNLQFAFDQHADVPLFDNAIKQRITLGDETVYKVEICHYDQDVFKAMEAQLDDSLSVSSSWPTNREITSANVHKGSALIKLCEILNCNIQDCVAIGDGRNDLELLQTAGYSIAMGNAKDFLKEHCDYITSNCNDSGVADAVTYILKQHM